MYLRFTVPGTVTRARVAPGPFRIASDLYWDGTQEDDPVLVALRRELDWFNENLPIPKRFGVVAKGVTWRDGVCWFRDDAREMLAHMQVLASLVAELDIPVTRHWTRDPGQVLYRDRWQVVAKPERSMLH